MTREPYRYSLAARAFLLCAGFVTALTVLSARLVILQYVRHEETLAKLDKSSLHREPILPVRGDLIDRHGKVLATCRPVSDLAVDKFRPPKLGDIVKIALRETGVDKSALRDFQEEDYLDLYYRLLARRLARPLLRSEEELYAELSGWKKDFVLHKDLPAQEAHQLVNELWQNGYRGLRLEDKIERVYTGKELACHAIGYVYHPEPEKNLLLRGAEGVEKSLNGILTGEPGYREYAEDGTLVVESPARNGHHVMLTIDAAFQGTVESILQRHWDELTPKRMTAVFADPHSGEILAMANLPNYSPADGGNADPEMRWNTAIASQFEPGSPFKLVVHGAAMNEGLVSLETNVRCFGGQHKESGWLKPLRDVGHHVQYAPVRDVIGYSLNTGTYSVARKLDPVVYHQYMKRFGFGQRTGILLSGESPGTVPPPSQWAQSTFLLSRLGMGYNVTATPLQVLNLMSIVCNRGDLVRLKLVKQVFDAETEQKTIVEGPEVVRNVISPSTAYRLHQALVFAAESGTGKRALVEGYVVGGKTGTANRHFPGKGYINGRNVTSYLGFIGQAESPALIGFVLVDDPRTEGRPFGGTIAAPIFREIAEAGMHHLGVRPAELTASKNDDAGGAGH